jgi:hypothetical protein
MGQAAAFISAAAQITNKEPAIAWKLGRRECARVGISGCMSGRAAVFAAPLVG